MMSVDAPFVRQVVCEDPRVRTVQGLVPPSLCSALIDMARSGLRPAKRFAPDGVPREMEGRTNTAAILARSSDAVRFVQARIALATGLPVEAMEGPQVLRYEVGQEFQPHHDFLPPKISAVKGQRLLTAIVYLNDDFEGGETDFPLLKLRLRAPAGDAIYFANVKQGALDARTLHAGLPPTRGEKWVLSQWIRDRAQAPFQPRTAIGAAPGAPAPPNSPASEA